MKRIYTSMKRIYTSLSIVAATLALAGCATPLALIDAQQPKAPQPKGDLNTHACRDFEEEAGSIARDVLESSDDPPGGSRWARLRLAILEA